MCIASKTYSTLAKTKTAKIIGSVDRQKKNNLIWFLGFRCLDGKGSDGKGLDGKG